jgi:hypothetical protein
VVFSAACVAASAYAELKVAAPSEVCAALNGVGLATSGWKPTYDTFQCLSQPKELSNATPANNLAFYADGERAKVRVVKLVLNVNDRTKASASLNELLKAAEVLCAKVTGAQLPAEARIAIKGGKPASARAGASWVEVARDDWPTGKGHEVQVLIR